MNKLWNWWVIVKMFVDHVSNSIGIDQQFCWYDCSFNTIDTHFYLFAPSFSGYDCHSFQYDCLSTLFASHFTPCARIFNRFAHQLNVFALHSMLLALHSMLLALHSMLFALHSMLFAWNSVAFSLCLYLCDCGFWLFVPLSPWTALDDSVNQAKTTIQLLLTNRRLPPWAGSVPCTAERKTGAVLAYVRWFHGGINCERFSGRQLAYRQSIRLSAGFYKDFILCNNNCVFYQLHSFCDNGILNF